jgi:hypothetical protein
MYSLSKIDPMKTDPEQIRVAIADGDGDGMFTLRLAELCLDKELPDGDVL